MESELLNLLNSTLQPAEGPRRSAEEQLIVLHTNDGFPIALSNIASSLQLPLNSRQAALTSLKGYITACWSPTFEDYKGPTTKIEIKDYLKPLLLGLITDQQRKVRSIAAAIVGKIAASDYPEEWPELLLNLLNLISDGNDTEANGALHVLDDVLEEGLGDEHFFKLAKEIVELLYKVATDQGRTFSTRALATCTFKSCIDILGIMRGDHEEEVRNFAQYAINLWVPFITSVLEAPLHPNTDETSTKGLMTLKIQAIRTIMQTRMHFTPVFNMHIEKLFAATWMDMNNVKDRYVTEFVKEVAEGRLVDIDALPYSLDLYILEQLDFIQSCLGNKIVRDQVEQAGFDCGNASPFSQMVSTTLALSQIAGEDQSMWDIDLNVFLSEETAVSANYTPRTASGDLILKLGEFFPQKTVESLYDHTQRVFASGGSIQLKESSLYLWDQLLNEWTETAQFIDAVVATNLLNYIVAAIGSEEDQFLRARGYSAAATLTKAAYQSITDKVTQLMDQSIRASTSDTSTIVQITALRAFQKYCDSVPRQLLLPFQLGIITAIRAFLTHKNDDDPEDSQDALTELVETIRSSSTINFRAVLDPSLQLPELLFSIASNGTTNLHLLGLIRDTFESLSEGLIAIGPPDIYVPLCEKILPTVTSMMDLDTSGQKHPLRDLATEVLQVLIENGSSPLPNGFVATVMPRLAIILLQSEDPDVVQSGCSALKEIVRLDCNQLVQWNSSEGKSGLELTLVIIDRLLRPQFSESAAMEVGGLAAELVDRVGDQLGQFLPELLRAVAIRLQTASLPPFVQSLILVFARLVLKQAKDVVDFLASLRLGDYSGLKVVMAAWLAHTNIFTGYDEIYQNVLALCHLYNLQDSRLNEIMVQGDLIIPESSRIITRSRAKQNPDEYTIVPVPLKIIKLLIQELGPGMSDSGRLYGGQHAVDEIASDDEWEDMPEGLNIPGMTREELLALGTSGRTSRQADDETYAVLSSFFKELSANNVGNFGNLYKALKPEEQHQLSQLR